jgi:hypothetical protein
MERKKKKRHCSSFKGLFPPPPPPLNSYLAIVFAILIPLCFCQKIYAQSIMDQYFDGDSLNQQIKSYIVNVSNLIPDSTTLQSVWSYSSKDFFFGVGLNTSFTFLERKLASRVLDGAEGFGGSHMDLAKFPTAVPYLPGMAIDLRLGTGDFDIGLCGMWMNEGILGDFIGSGFLGDSSHFTYRMIGLDVRFVPIVGRSSYQPTLTLQAGYYFTWMGFGIESGSTEKVDVQFRNDTYLMAAQFSLDVLIFVPYIGAKLLFSKTDSGFSWETDRPVMVKGTPYPDGASYNSGGKDGDLNAYFQIYFGTGITFIFPHLITLGGAYNVVTNHFGVNLAVRLILGY